ncbi:MAG: hypothetical protein VYD18_16855 [Candidatus Latescibacterota bacterium]|nr:hypothetical protein [Candidatus Latescibacterota bacterium]
MIPSVGDSMSVYLDEAGGQAISNLPSASHFDQVPFDVRPWVRYRLSLQLLDGRLASTLSYPVIVSCTETESSGFGAVAAIDNLIASTFGETRYSVLDDGSLDRSSEFEIPTSEIRLRSTDAGNRMGLCFSDQNRVLVGRPSVSSFKRHPHLAAGDHRDIDRSRHRRRPGRGRPVLPPFRRGPDDRYFVLDAEGKCLTQWGRGEVGTLTHKNTDDYARLVT